MKTCGRITASSQQLACNNYTETASYCLKKTKDMHLYLVNLFQLNFPLTRYDWNRIVLAARYPLDASEILYTACTEISS